MRRILEGGVRKGGPMAFEWAWMIIVRGTLCHVHSMFFLTHDVEVEEKS